LVSVVQAVAAAGDYARAERMIRAFPLGQDRHQSEALTGIARILAETGQRQDARRLAADAETIARSKPPQPAGPWEFAAVACALAQTGEFDRAYRVTRKIDDGYCMVKTLADLIEAGAHERQPRIVEEALEVAYAIHTE